MPVRPLKVGTQLEVAATQLHPDGTGIGQLGETPVHVKDLLPGERARVRIEHVSPHRPHTAWTHVERRLTEPAPERVEPMCPRFAECGGCSWQHLAYPAQLQHKRARVVRALRAHGLGHIDVAEAIGAPEMSGYRNVGKYVVARLAMDHAGGDATDPPLVLGSYAPRSHNVVNTAGCRVVEPVIDAVREQAASAWRHLPLYDEQTRTGWLRYVTIRAGRDGTVLIAVVTSPAADRASVAAGAAELGADPRVSGVVWVRNDRKSGVIIDGESEILYGRATVREQVAGVDVDLGVHDFFQVNRAQIERLYGEVARLAGLGPGSLDVDATADGERQTITAIDAYCGVGGIAFTLAVRAGQRGHSWQVHGIERNARTVERARQAAARTGLSERLVFHVGDATDMARIAPDVLVVNPPRKGLSSEARTVVEELAPQRLVYVSCGPESLARDLAALAGSYRVIAVQPIDLMPGTSQIETVVGLRR